MSGNTEDVLEVLREVWSAQGQTAEDVEEACGNTKSCKRMTDVGFDGLAEETDGDLRVAWRTRSEYEWVQHVRMAARCGITAAEVEAIGQGADAGAWSELEADVLTATDQLLDQYRLDVCGQIP